MFHTAASLRRRASIMREAAERCTARAKHARRVRTDFWQAIAAEADRTARRSIEQAERLDAEADQITASRFPWPLNLMGAQ